MTINIFTGGKFGEKMEMRKDEGSAERRWKCGKKMEVGKYDGSGEIRRKWRKEEGGKREKRKRLWKRT